MGAATAILLAERGAAVTLVGRRSVKLEEVAGEIRPFDDASVARASLQRILTTGVASPQAGSR